MNISRGEVRKRTWRYEGRKRTAWGFTVRVGGKQVRRQGFPSREVAQDELDKFKAEKLKPKPVVVEITFAEAAKRYVTENGGKRTISEDRRILGHEAKPVAGLTAFFGPETPLSKITAARISEYKAARRAATSVRRKDAAGNPAPLSAASINRPLAVLRHLLRTAHEEWEVLSAVPRVRLEKEPEGRIRWLEVDEERTLLDSCKTSKSKHLLDVVAVALESGMRYGEIMGLTWERVDLSRGIIRLERTKSDRRRDVPMRQAVYEILARRKAKVQEKLKEKGGGTATGRVFPATSIRTAFENAVATAGVAPFRFHDTWHHFASWFVMRGGSLPALQKILGHATLQMTMRYAHLAPDHLRAEIARTERPEHKVSTTADTRASAETPAEKIAQDSA